MQLIVVSNEIWPNECQLLSVVLMHVLSVILNKVNNTHCQIIPVIQVASVTSVTMMATFTLAGLVLV